MALQDFDLEDAQEPLAPGNAAPEPPVEGPAEFEAEAGGPQEEGIPAQAGTPLEVQAEGCAEGQLVLLLGPFSDEGTAGAEALGRAQAQAGVP